MNIIHYLFVIVVISIFQQSVEGQRNAGCVRPRIENGRAKVRARGKMVYFRCRKKFTRIGPKFAVCLPNSVWSQPAPICIGRGCPPIVPKDGLQISGEYGGAMLKFTCPAGMKREGPESIHCNGKKWNADQPSCVGNNDSMGISLQCDFEQEELCGWSQSDDDDFEWTWFSGQTPTVNTGPLRDHTHSSNSSGHYLFIESSSPRKPLDRAVLASPLYQAKYSSTCFEFWYHMQGPEEDNAVGSLEVFVKPESQSINDINPEFIMEGNQGADWKRGSMYIQSQTEVFQIIIVGTRKEAFVSDIAIDDVKMYNCSEDSITDGTDDITTESVPTFLDGQSTVDTRNITPSTASAKTSATTITVKISTITATEIVTTRPSVKTTKKPTTAWRPPTIIKTSPSITTSVKTTPEPKTKSTISKTQKKTTTTTIKPTMRRKTIKTTRRRQNMKTTMSLTTVTSTPKPVYKTTPKITRKTTKRRKTMKTTRRRENMKTTMPLTPKPAYKTTPRITSKATSSIKASTSTVTKMSTRKGNTKHPPITPIVDAIKPRTTINTTQVMPSSVAWQATWNTTTSILRLSTDGNITINSSDIGIGMGKAGGKSMTPLMIGLSCGIAVGVIIVIVVIVYVWTRRQRNKLSDETIEEMAPITNAEGGYYHPS